MSEAAGLAGPEPIRAARALLAARRTALTLPGLRVTRFTRVTSGEAEEQTHICVASRQFEEGQVKLPDPRNN